MNRTRAERKARNAQRRDGRDQHVVSEMRRIELAAALDAAVVSCESCGFLVVDSGSFCWWRSDLDPPTRTCVCGGPDGGLRRARPRERRRANGHRRPLGTTTRVRMRWSSVDGRDPQLGDVTLEQESDRWFLVVGVEEHRDSPAVWWLTLERIDEDDANGRLRGGSGFWPHCRDRRPR